MASIPSDEVLPCGCLIRCVIENGVNTLVISPCKQDCINLQNTLSLGQEKGLNLEYRKGR